MSEEIITGGLYARRDADGKYSITKVLAVDEDTVHLRMYATRFQSLPSTVRSADLSMISQSSDDGIGIGHFPLAREAFEPEGRIFLGREEVSDDELDGYRIWAGIDPIE